MTVSDRDQQVSLILKLIDALREKDSWGGATAIQKTAYMLKTMMGVPLEFDFILYRYGPYSQELMNDLNALCADRLVRLERQNPDYGPKYFVDETGIKLCEALEPHINQYRKQIDFVAQRLGDRDIGPLERISTALWVTNRFKDAGKKLNEEEQDKEERDKEKRAEKLHYYKRHIPMEFCRKAVDEIDALRKEAQEKGLILSS